MLRVGIYSGTFDPVHRGHISFALRALEVAELDRVVFIPEAEPRRKSAVTPFRDRLRMLELATAGQGGLSVIGLKSKQFTVQATLPELRALFPNAQLFFMLGSDVVATFKDSWPEDDLVDFLHEMPLVVGLRGGATEAVIQEQLKSLPTRATCISLNAPHPAVSSSQVRQDPPLGKDVPTEVARYITEHKLYEGVA